MYESEAVRPTLAMCGSIGRIEGLVRGRVLELLHAEAEPGLEEESPAFAATVEEPKKEPTPRLD